MACGHSARRARPATISRHSSVLTLLASPDAMGGIVCAMTALTQESSNIAAAPARSVIFADGSLSAKQGQLLSSLVLQCLYRILQLVSVLFGPPALPCARRDNAYRSAGTWSRSRSRSRNGS